MRGHIPTLALFSVLSLAIVAAPQAASRPDADASGSAAPGGSARDIAGTATVVDGDTLKVAGETIRLHGIDAAEVAQSCATGPASGDRAASRWPCGLEARRTLTRLIGAAPVTCIPLALDRYGRTVARCLSGGRDLGAELVRLGQAWAFVRYSSEYLGQEKEARAAKRGIWQADTQPAWDFRSGAWQAAEAAAPNGCTIKGNVSWTGERIYHLPWSPWYGSVKMDDAVSQRKGKRWFCNEAEAQAAGWRPSATR